MDEAIAIKDEFERRIEADGTDTDEVIDAFDHVLEALDQIILLAELARPKGAEVVRR
jgi:hypothetical protein